MAGYQKLKQFALATPKSTHQKAAKQVQAGIDRRGDSAQPVLRCTLQAIVTTGAGDLAFASPKLVHHNVLSAMRCAVVGPRVNNSDVC